MSSKYHWLVVGGCPRSGTTMMNFVLNSHPQVCLSNEQDLQRTISLIDKAFYREDHIRTRKQRTLSERELAVGEYNEKVLNSTITRAASLLPALEALFESSLVKNKAQAGIVYLGDKFPKYYSWNHQKLALVIGNIKYIHITRSPLDVISSSLFRSKMSRRGEDWWRPGSTVEYAEEWISAWNFAASKQSECDKINFLHLKYEDFIQNPHLEIKKIAEFLEIDDRFDLSFVYSKKGGGNNLSNGEINSIMRYLPSDILAWKEPLAYYLRKYTRLEITVPVQRYLISHVRSRIRRAMPALTPT